MPRVFYALWPDGPARDALDRARREAQRTSGGRAMRRDNLHQTLVFVGSVDAEKISALETVAGSIAAAPFTLEFGAAGYWRHNRIVWAAPGAMPPALTGLVTALEQELTQAGFTFDHRSYFPHVTLLRNARMPTHLPSMLFAWPVREFVLLESARGPRGAEYRVVKRWALTG
ncbi:MAG: RNA 2',3'-cyclic phosphodiesterase [Burkholderiales bacterium]